MRTSEKAQDAKFAQKAGKVKFAEVPFLALE